MKDLYTNPGFVYHIQKRASDLVYRANFSDTWEIREFYLVGPGDWKLKNTDFRKIKTPDWCIWLFK